ncbi:MAG: Kiwa anti-phage protein KwaB-like domain-containing protein [Candidatus Saccharibacteria bacterium]
MEKTNEHADIFLWANRIDGIKKEIDVEFFLFNKHYTPYSTNFSSELNSQIKPLFLYDLVNFVNMGAGTGLSVRDFELSDCEENVLLRTDLENVGRAETLLNIIEHQRSEIVEFSEQEHEFKRIKGILARFTHKDSKSNPFYAIKLISQGQVLNGPTAWEFRDGKFGSFKAEVGLKVPTDNQVLIINKDIFVFNQSKFERIFNYDYKKQALAEQKVAEIEKQFRLSFPDGLDMQSIVRERKKAINKLQKIEIGNITQEQVIDYADRMELEMMTDNSGAIIIMDGLDLDMFVNLINEDYMKSEITGQRYEVKSKKILGEPEGEPPRG